MQGHPRNPDSDLRQLELIKRLAIRALVSDGMLFDRLVLKGGSAIDLIHGVGNRASIDLDFSIDGDLPEGEIGVMEEKLGQLLQAAFERRGFRVFDVRFRPKPENVTVDLASFWGGYGLVFKLITSVEAERIGGDIDAMRRHAAVVGPGQRKTFQIDFSRFEYCGDKQEYSVDGFAVFAYPPRLIVAEKMRAICQQSPQYRRLVKSPGGSLRARDYFDIVNVVKEFDLRLVNSDFRALVHRVFAAKRVPIELLWAIDGLREFHRPDFPSVLDTVPPGTPVLTFDEYADFVAELARSLQPLGYV